MEKLLEKSPAEFNDIGELRKFALELKEEVRGKEAELEDLCNTVLYFLTYLPDSHMTDRRTVMLYRLALKLKK